jgi:FkbM family methyltransferase
MKYRTYFLLIENSKNLRRLQDIDASEISLTLLDFLLKNCGDSHSQLFQDLIVTYLVDNYSIDSRINSSKIFIEFGACDGVKFSNTFLLEKNGWHGIVAEPAKKWHKDLQANRKCTISLKAVSNITGKQVQFIETIEGEFSSLASNSQLDQFAEYRKNNTTNKYMVETISLNDLIQNNGIKFPITYLSIDTEGGEREILESFDFKTYNPAIISVEHNFSGEQEQLDIFLSKFGYVKILTTLSKFENWYVQSDQIKIPQNAKF